MESADTEGDTNVVAFLSPPDEHQQKEAITRLGRRYAAYLVIVLVVLVAAVLGGVCGSDRCSSSEGISETPGCSIIGQSPAGTTEAPTTSKMPSFEP